MADRPNVPERLALLAYQTLYPGLHPDVGTAEFQAIADRVLNIWDAADKPLRQRLQRVRTKVDDSVRDNSAELRGLLVQLLAAAMDEPTWQDTPEEIRHARARLALGRPAGSDERHVEEWWSASATEGGASDKKGIDMADNDGIYRGEYDYDPRGLPETFDPSKYRSAIYQLAKDRNADPQNDPLDKAQAAHVAGSLLLGSYDEPTSPGFEDAFVEQFNEGFELVETVDVKKRWRRLDVYARVAYQINRLKAANDTKPTVQEISAVSDEVIDRGPVDDNFVAKVRSAHDDFVAKTPVYDSLDLPDIVTDDTAQAEVEPANIRAVGMIYATSELENTQLIAACDQAAQDWSDGVLPVGENSGRLFDAYVWNARDRLDAAARQIQYERIEELSAHILRFCSATSERDRAQYLSEYLTPGDGRPSAQPRDAAVRKTARDLLAYASLHGWAYTQFAAKRVGNQVRQCVAIIQHPEVQKAYGVQGPWQVVERVAAMNNGAVPEISKHRALASTGKAILDLLASKAKDIAASLPKDPMFPPPSKANGQRSVFSRAEYDTLLNLVESWLAASTVNDRERLEASQPAEVKGSPSLPSFGAGVNSASSNGFDAEAVKNQLLQMVSTGQMPTADQVQQFFNHG